MHGTSNLLFLLTCSKSLSSLDTLDCVALVTSDGEILHVPTPSVLPTKLS
jgi:hypothetical protein